MLTLSDMNPCGLTLITGLPCSGKTTALKSLASELKDTESFAVVDMEQEDWASASGGLFFGEVTNDAQLKELITTSGFGTILINGIQFLQVTNGSSLLEFLEELRVIAKARELRIVMTLQTRRPALGSSFSTVTEGGGPTIEGVTDGFIHHLSVETA